MKQFLRLTGLLLVVLVGLNSNYAFAQGSTTANINGRVVDENGEPIPGATVIATHTPTGSAWGNVTDSKGYYRLANTNVGGPYKVTVSYVGYKTFEQNNIYLTLGQTFNLSVQMAESSTELSEVEILGNTGDIFDGNRTGQETIINEKTINTMPTISRAIGDFARLNPLANIDEGGDGFSISLGGMNNRYNAIYIDGAVNNDVFGLAGSGTNGGQTGVSPISIDAIEQFQVSIAPFDVRQSGFAGGAINAVTRSGSNDFKGSAYYFTRNENLAGKTPTDNPDFDRTKLDEFSAKTYGFRLGGPILKNKLFFFVNAELQRDETPQPFDPSTYEGTSTQGDISQLVNKLNGYGYNPGGYTNNTAYLNSDKLLIRLDYNLHKNHKLTLRHSYTKADNLEAVRSTTRNIRFLAESEQFVSNTHSTALELKSTIGNDMSNSLIIGTTFVRDQRDPYRDAINFPYVRIRDGVGTITFGSEQFSTANQLDQDVITVTNNFEIYKGKHTITIGTHNEFYNTYNLFIRQNFGAYEYSGGLSQFLNDEPADEFVRSYSLVDDRTGDGSGAAAEFSGMQLGLYVQDDFQATDRLKLTFGVRVDVPIFNDPVRENADFNNETIPLLEAAGYDLNGANVGGSLIDPQFMLAPRLGFNFDVNGDKTTQIRGGLGIFNSRMPLVWWGGAYNNNGRSVGGDFTTSPTSGWYRDWDGFFNPQWDDQPQRVAPGSGDPSGQIDIFDPNMKLPQVFKTNIAIDQKLPGGFVFTGEFLYSKFMNNILYSNYNLKPATERLTGTPDDRLLYNRRDEIDDSYSRILYGTNTNKGYTWNAAFTLSKPFENGLTANISYSYGDAWTVYDGTSSQNSSQWRGLHTVDGRNGFNELQRSDFSAGGRVIGQVSYRKEYGDFGASQLSMFYNGQAGRPYSYIYGGGNLTNEDSRYRSLIYVPANQNEINLIDEDGRTAAQQWQELNAFIESEDYLSERRGQYAERNMSRAPWNHIIDLRFLQDFYIETASGKRNTLQFSVDIFNFTNFLNKDWGRLYFVPSSYQLLDFEGFEAGTNTPTFTFPGVDNNEPWNDNIDDSGFRSSRWQIQVGVRYIFE